MARLSKNITNFHWLSQKGITIKFSQGWALDFDPYEEPIVNKLKKLFKKL